MYKSAFATVSVAKLHSIHTKWWCLYLSIILQYHFRLSMEDFQVGFTVQTLDNIFLKNDRDMLVMLLSIAGNVSYLLFVTFYNTLNLCLSRNERLATAEGKQTPEETLFFMDCNAITFLYYNQIFVRYGSIAILMIALSLQRLRQRKNCRISWPVLNGCHRRIMTNFQNTTRYFMPPTRWMLRKKTVCVDDWFTINDWRMQYWPEK